MHTGIMELPGIMELQGMLELPGMMELPGLMKLPDSVPLTHARKHARTHEGRYAGVCICKTYR